jgi:hypothetical protein
MAEMDKNIEKAFDFAQEATKQLIALATDVIALTITFLTDVIKTAPSGSAGFLQAAWVLYLISIVLGILTLLMLTGNLERPGVGKDGVERDPSIYRGNIAVCSIGQVLTFSAAVTLTLVFGFKAV